MSLNVWNTQRWPTAKPAAHAARAGAPTCCASRSCDRRSARLIDSALSDHRARSTREPGWTHEGNMWWDAPLRAPRTRRLTVRRAERDRRLFWVRLRHLHRADRELVVATAHLTWLGWLRRGRDRRNPRLAQTQRSSTPSTMSPADGPCLLMGDLNDPGRARPGVLRDAGFSDAWDPRSARAAGDLPRVPEVDGELASTTVPARLDLRLAVPPRADPPAADRGRRPALARCRPVRSPARHDPLRARCMTARARTTAPVEALALASPSISACDRAS
jgi:hypothetical protein